MKENEMNDTVWKIADLTDEQLKEIKEAEKTLGPFSLLAFQPVRLDTAQLNPSQLECLQGLEKNLGITIVAYRK
jgi:hypothetical protein